MITDNEIKIYPEWFTDKDEKKGLDEIRDFLRSGNYPVSALLIEKDSFFVAASVPEVTDELRRVAYQFNDGSHPLLFDFVDSDRPVRGEAFHV